MTRPLRRSRRHCLIAGVCGGIAERVGWSPLVVRILFVAGAILPIFPGAVAYLVLWLVLPKDVTSADRCRATSRGRASRDSWPPSRPRSR